MTIWQGLGTIAGSIMRDKNQIKFKNSTEYLLIKLSLFMYQIQALKTKLSNKLYKNSCVCKFPQTIVYGIKLLSMGCRYNILVKR